MAINQPKAAQLVAYGGDTLSTLGTTNFDCHLKCWFNCTARSMRLILLMPFKQPFLTNTLVYLKAILVLNLPVLYKIRLDRNSTPVGRPPRKVPLAVD